MCVWAAHTVLIFRITVKLNTGYALDIFSWLVSPLGTKFELCGKGERVDAHLCNFGYYLDQFASSDG